MMGWEWVEMTNARCNTCVKVIKAANGRRQNNYMH